MDREAWRPEIHGVAESRTRLSDSTELMDLALQVPMQYCSLQHLTLLLLPVTSKLGVVFALAPSLHSSVLFLHCSPGEAYWAPTDLVSLSSVSYSSWHTGLLSLSVQFTSITQLCPTLCDAMNRSMPGLPVHQQLPEFTQTHVHPVSDAIQPSHPRSSPSPPAPNPSQHKSFPMSQLFA